METQAKDARESVTQTLAILKEQTDNALISAKAATVSARAANDQIQMMKGRERARISVSVSDEEFEVESQAFNAITIKITNDGPTSAFNISAIGEALGQQGQALPFMGCQIPLKTRSVISANNEPIPTEVVFVSHHDLRNIHESPIPYFFHVAGEVNYEDVFGERRKTTFRYRLQVMAVRTSAETKRVKIRSILGWRKCGTPEENKPT